MADLQRQHAQLLDDAAYHALTTELEPLRTLEQVVRWGLSQSPPRLVSNVVTQDEYSLDVCLPIGQQRVLVFDAT